MNLHDHGHPILDSNLIFLGNTPPGLRISNLPSDLPKNVLEEICSEFGINILNYKTGGSYAFAHYNQR